VLHRQTTAGNHTVTFFFSAYGLRLASSQPIPGLTPSPAASSPDVTVHLGSMPAGLENPSSGSPQVIFSEEGPSDAVFPTLTASLVSGGSFIHFRYVDGTEFLLDRAGTRVWAVWREPLTLEDTVTYLLGPVMAFVLRLRGIVCLHASAVAVEDRALALLGPGGAGKSTTAAVFARLGYAVLADDALAVLERGDSFLAQPAYPRVRLWPESVRALYGSDEALPLLTPNWEKRYLTLDENQESFQPDPLPLAAIYILDERSEQAAEPAIETVAPQAALVSLITNSYVNYLLDKTMRSQEFDFLGRLVNRVPVRRVLPLAGPEHLPGLCGVIAEDFRSLVRAAHAPQGA